MDFTIGETPDEPGRPGPPHITGVKAESWEDLQKHWWQLGLIALCLSGFLAGCVFILFTIVWKLWRHLAQKKRLTDNPKLQARVIAHLQKYAASRSGLTFEKKEKKRPTSLGVYLGKIDSPMSPDQMRVLVGRDLVILDPFQPNTTTALAELDEHPNAPRFILSRLDLNTYLASHTQGREPENFLITSLDQILGFVSTHHTPGSSNYAFTGILFSGWEFIPTPVLHELGNLIYASGLEVYLETSAPDFLAEPSSLTSECISGIVIRNGLILPNGERRDCFDISPLRMTVKAFVSQSCVRSFNVFLWDTVDDDVKLSNAVLKRTFTWCSFHSVVPWIGPQEALYNASSVKVIPCEPLSAFAWLKEPRVMELHEMWKNKRAIQHSNHRHSMIGPLSSMIPSFEAARTDCLCEHEAVTTDAIASSIPSESMEWFVLRDELLGDPLCTSPSGKSYSGLGCFALGVDVSVDDFQEIVFSQRNLRKLELLDSITPADLREYGIILTNFLTVGMIPSEPAASSIREEIADLAKTLVASPEDGSEGVRMFLGLQSGFQRTIDRQFWAVYHVHPSQTMTDIYISKSANDLIGTLLHTFLSRRGMTRRQCFQAEISFAQWNHSLLSPHNIPPRAVQDIELLSPEECLFVLQRVSLTPDAKDDPLLTGAKSAIMERIVDVPTWKQLQAVNTVRYLKGDITVEELLRSRLQWHCQCKRRHPTLTIAISLFREVEEKIVNALRTRNQGVLQTIIDSLGTLQGFSTADAVGDLFALSVFCTMRNQAFEEVYIEVTDRNPLFNDQSDQAAAFAELFALGSRCESYFDVSPSQFGELLDTKFRTHYSTSENQPPLFEKSQVALPSAYAEAQIDVDPNYKPHEMPSYKRFTFLSVFAIPALIDILMLSTTGHGLYLSGTSHNESFMTYEEQHSATTALMISLLLSGAIGTWITCGGTYYFASMAFSAMNYFVVTRLLGGLAFTLVAGLVGFIAFACKTSPYAGLIFFLYLIVLTTYLSLLAALANYQFTGSAFHSGRSVIICCIPLLFVSPITTIFYGGHDIIIYLSVLYVFVLLLLLGVRWTGSRWTTWYQKIDLVTDAELRTWYAEKNFADNSNTLDEMSDPAVLRLARQALLHDVLSEQGKSIFSKKTDDQFVIKLVRSFKATEFLMLWYYQFTGVPKPVLFSSAWNVQTKVALFSLQKSQLGIRFHNGFLHWRQAGDEIGCTMLYFIVALLDKWIALINGGNLFGLINTNISLPMPVGFGLAYYLIGAVLLDFNAHKLHELAAKTTEGIVSTDEGITHAVKARSDNRRKVYWKTLARYMMLHVWGLGATSLLLWLFSSTSKTGVLIFLSYVLAYTGLLWYQYTKVFSGPYALKPLIIANAVGLPIGFILNHEAPHFPYSGIVALGAATWTAAILSLWGAKIVGPTEDDPHVTRGTEGMFYAYSGPGPDEAWSQPELQSLYVQLSDLSEKERLLVDPESEFGSQVKLILEQCSHNNLPELAKRAFPEADVLLKLSIKLFKEGQLRVELIASEHFTDYDKSLRALSTVQRGTVRILLACETKRVSKNQNPLQGFYWDVAELLVQVAAERFLGYNTHDALLARTLWLSNGIWNKTSSPDVLGRHLKLHTQSNGLSQLIEYLKKQLLRDLYLGFDCNLDSEDIPGDLRKYLINRCVGISGTLTEEQARTLNGKVNHTPGLSFETYVARSNLAAFAGARMLGRALAWAGSDYPRDDYVRQSHEHSKILLSGSSPETSVKVIDLLAHATPPKYTIYDQILRYSGAVYHYLGTLCKFFSIAFVADPEYQREVRCTFPSSKTNVVHSATQFFLLSVWAWAKAIQRLLLPFFLLYNRKNVVTIWKNLQGIEVSIKRRRVVIRNLDGVSTGFIHRADEATFRLLQYGGDHHTEPANNASLISINMYSKNMSLLRRVEMESGNTVNDYIYEYKTPDPTVSKSLSKSDLFTSPLTRKCIAGRNSLQDIAYNSKGQIDSGSYIKDGDLIRFQYHYQKAPKYNGALLRAEFVLPYMSCTVSWCASPRWKQERLESWIPHSQVTEATFVVSADVWECKYFYDHNFHPTILTTLNGQRVDTPNFILYDHLNFLKKPQHVSFLDDNPLFGFNTIRTTAVTRWLGVDTRRYPVSTTQSRSWLWRAWKDDPTFDGVIVRWLDERLLRRDLTLKPYWRKRDSGHLDAAEQYLDKNRDAVMASVDLDSTISKWTPLAMKINDLYSFGQGGDACSRTRSNVTAQEDDETALHVIAVDTGTWPNEGGGVSACRSDVINNLRTIKWHMVAESANDFGIPKRQIERNIYSLKIIPLWGLDLLTPTHGLFANRLDSELDYVTSHITLLDIERNFVPVLTALVCGARALEVTMRDIKQSTRALVNLNSYFKGSRHWSAVWQSDVVKSAWRHLWMSQIEPNARPSSEWFDTEHPTLSQFDQGLELWSRYLFIYSIPIPEKMPAVFQASHHSVSASYGVVCKLKRGCTLQIWDHAISWRETNLYLSSALCALSPFVRNSLLGLMKMTSVLTLHHADTILPCADFFNPNWEIEIGTCQGKIENRASFRRKIDPVVNGITNMERFTPVQEIQTKTPTVTMLSHIWYAKDIKTALLSADIIVNQWGFKDFQLEIYGALDKSPSYTTNCQEIIATKSLRRNVTLRGEADPIKVLQRTWVFLNSSVSEGLPLALGEAALTGAPVVCTDVGASLRVLTNPDDGSCYSAVVAPNDAHAIARAQIKMLALLDEWAPYSDPSACSRETGDSSFPEIPTAEDATRITRRMYEQTGARRKLGMRGREIVQKNFSGDRYLREHEQMLWIGKAKKDMGMSGFSRPSACIMTPAPVQISGGTTPIRTLRRSIQRESISVQRQSTRNEDSLPSLAFSSSSTVPMSIVSEMVPSTLGPIMVGEQEWIKKPVRPVMIVNI